MNVAHTNTPPSASSDFLPAPEDEALILRIAQRDMHALSILYDRYARAIYAFIWRIVKDTGATEGLVQETFLQIWHNADEFQGTGALGAWIFRIARTRALDHLRRTKTTPPPR
jgi:RNA polymerase sigma-70 factor (ECF subfamily)